MAPQQGKEETRVEGPNLALPYSDVARESKDQLLSLGLSPRCLAGMVTEDTASSFLPSVGQLCSEAHAPQVAQVYKPPQGLSSC